MTTEGTSLDSVSPSVITTTSSSFPVVSSTLSSRSTEFEENQQQNSFIPKVGSIVYTRQDYWDNRFAKEDTYEWLAGWNDVIIKETLENLFQSIIPLPYTKEHLRILLLGTGNSPFPIDLAKEGYQHIYATDYSETVIQRMQEKYGTLYPNIQWEVQDMTGLTYTKIESSSTSTCTATKYFDVVIDKAAMDAILADGGDVWKPPTILLKQAYKVCDQVSKVLYHPSINESLSIPRLRNGLFLQLSFSQPHFRRQYLLQSKDKDQLLNDDNNNNNSISSSMSTTTIIPSTSVSLPNNNNNDDDLEWEPDKNPHIQPHHIHQQPNIQDTFWKSFTVINIPVGLGYYLYVGEINDS